MFPLTSNEIEPIILIAVIVFTLGLGLITISRLCEFRLKVMVACLLFGVFCYSGYGISYVVVDNAYLWRYAVYILALCLPMMFFGSRKHQRTQDSDLDSFLNRHKKFVAALAFLYLLCSLVPLVYPEFKLFRIFESPGMSLRNLWSDRWAYHSNPLIALVDALAVFFMPFFYIFLTQIQSKGKHILLTGLLFLLSVLMLYSRYAYLGRYQMVAFGLIFYLFLFCVRGYRFRISKKNVITLAAIGISIIPLLYAFTFTRIGGTADSSVSLLQIVGLLIDSEAYYPIYYDLALHSSDLSEQTAWGFLAWLLFLPVPSFLFPGKPTLQGDAFTYAVSGKSFGDENFSSALPSALGEAFMYFGADYYWVEALLIGAIIIFVLGYLVRHRTLHHYTIYLIVFSLTFGRGGAASYMLLLINGCLSVYLLHLFVKLNRPKRLF